jgi:hypothetical protein
MVDMSDPVPPDLALALSRDLRSIGRFKRPSDSTGERRIRRGVFVDQAAWDEADARARYLARIRAVAETRQAGVVFSHESAAALLGLPLLDSSPPLVHATTSPDSRRRSRAGVAWHHRRLRSADTAVAGGYLVTSVGRTLEDVALTSSLAEAVVILDAGLLPEEQSDMSARAAAHMSQDPGLDAEVGVPQKFGDSRGGPLPPRWDSTCRRVTVDAVLSRLEALGSAPGVRRARAALALADGRSGSVGESLSRVQMFAWGVPLPELQRSIAGASGRRYLVDFAWDDGALIGEFDGQIKYSRGRIRGEASADEVVWAEKRREDDLRATGRDIVRWTWDEASNGHSLATLLARYGLASTARQPNPSSRKENHDHRTRHSPPPPPPPPQPSAPPAPPQRSSHFARKASRVRVVHRGK